MAAYEVPRTATDCHGLPRSATKSHGVPRSACIPGAAGSGLPSALTGTGVEMRCLYHLRTSVVRLNVQHEHCLSDRRGRGGFYLG